MKIKNIEKLNYEWFVLTDEVIKFKKVDLIRLHKLFKDSYIVIDEYSKHDCVPKVFVDLFVEINNFSWWVSDLNETPLHEFYQEIISLVSVLQRYFMARDYDANVIKDTIDNIPTGNFAIGR